MSGVQLSDAIAAAAGFFLTLAFSFIPGLRAKFDSLDVKYGELEGGNYKRLIMALLIIVIGFAAFGLACAGWLDKFAPSLSLACSENGLANLIMALFYALSANQSAFSLMPKRQDS